MDKQEFIEKFEEAEPELYQTYTNRVVRECIERVDAKYPKYEHGHMNLVSMTEELAECSEAIIHRMRGRTQDNYDILQEIGDVIIGLLCVAQIYGISENDICKAVNVKLDREAKRIEQWKQGLPSE